MVASPDGKYVAVGDTKGYVSVFNAETQEQAFYTANHKNKILSMSFSTDSSQLAALGFDKIVSLVPVEDSKSKRILESK